MGSDDTTAEGVPERALALLRNVEDALLAGLLLTMIVLAPTQILLRNFFDSAIAWGDPALRALVLWVGLLGALAASRGNRHISIDVLSHVVPQRLAPLVTLVTSLFTVGICGLVAYHGWLFVAGEREFQSTAFAGVPAWLVQSVIPFAFGMMAVRFGLLAIASLRDLVRGATATES